MGERAGTGGKRADSGGVRMGGNGGYGVRAGGASGG